MLNLPRPSCVRSVLFCLLLAAVAATTAKAQSYHPGNAPRPSTCPHRPWRLRRRHLQPATPTEPQSSTPSQRPSTSALATRRVLSSPSVTPGLRGSASKATTATPDTPTPSPPSGPRQTRGVQQNASEYTLGYVAHAKKQYFGMTPFASGGPWHARLPANPGRRRGPAQTGPRDLLLLRWRRDHRAVSPLWHSRTVPRRSSSKRPTLRPTT